MSICTTVWVALAVLLLMLGAYQKRKARADTDSLPVSGATEVLAVVTVLYGLVLLVLYFDGVLQHAQTLLAS